MLPVIEDLMKDAGKGFPYEGAKAHYVLDIDDAEISKKIIEVLEPITPLPKPRKKKLAK
jgi:hypothetical protein